MVAEVGRARELATDYVQEAVSALRLFHHANFTPEAICFCVVKGQEHLISQHLLLVSEGRLKRVVKGLVGRQDRRWVVSEKDVNDFATMGLGHLHAALLNPERSEFQVAALSALFLYTRASTRAELTDRLVYVFAALEGLLLKNQSEPIIQNIGDRLGFALEMLPDKRMATVKLIKDAYELRSRIIHHRAQIRDVETVRLAFQCAWRFFVLVVLPALPTCKTKAEFIEDIERVKYS